MNSGSNLTRREFIKQSAISAAVLTATTLVPGVSLDNGAKWIAAVTV